MIILGIVICGCTVVLASRYLFGNWFNHVSLYTLIWSFVLSMFQLRLINYYPLEIETWITIIICWLLFVLGAVLIYTLPQFTNHRFIPDVHPHGIGSQSYHLGKVKKTIWVLNVITFATALHDLYLVSKLFGSLTNALVFGNLLYSYRVMEGLPGSIPYKASLVFTAAMLSGYYTAKREKLTIVAVLPLVIIILIDLANMGRADILVVAIIFTTAYLITSKPQQESSRTTFSMRKVLNFGLVLLILIAGAELVRSTRNVKEGIKGSSQSLKKISAGSVITPSIYLYFSSTIGVLNQYLKDDAENTPIGGHTFLPVYRILEKIGMDKQAKVYQSWYQTPVKTNTGTYLRELHGDFGLVGLLLGPFFLGMTSSIFWFRYKKNEAMVDLAVLSYLFGIIGLSFFVMATRMGGYFVFIFVALFIGSALDGGRKRRMVNP